MNHIPSNPVIRQIAAVGTAVEAKTVMTYDGAGRVLSRTEAPGTAEAGTESYSFEVEGRRRSHGAC